MSTESVTQRQKQNSCNNIVVLKIQERFIMEIISHNYWIFWLMRISPLRRIIDDNDNKRDTHDEEGNPCYWRNRWYRL